MILPMASLPLILKKHWFRVENMVPSWSWGLCGLSQLVCWWRLCHLSKSRCQGWDSHHAGQGGLKQPTLPTLNLPCHRIMLKSYGVSCWIKPNYRANERSIQNEVTFHHVWGAISWSCDGRCWGTTFGELHWIHQKVPEPNFVPLRSVKIYNDDLLRSISPISCHEEMAIIHPCFHVSRAACFKKGHHPRSGKALTCATKATLHTNLGVLSSPWCTL